jgi:hypothetical protein
MLPDSLIRTAVFAGAGASRFAEMPTVDSFFERVEWPPSQGLSAACQELARRISIFEGTQENLAWPEFDAEKLFGWLELLEKTGKLYDSRMGIHIPNLSQAVPVGPVTSHLRSEIVRIYGSHIEPDVLSRAPHRSLIEVVDRLTPTNAPLYFFTTNYDPIIEQILEGEHAVSLTTGRRLRACTGFTAGRPGRWQPELLKTQPATGERLVNIVKLHGSATWKRDASGPIETGWGMPTPHDCLLYFGYKSVPEQEPFITFHTLLKTVLLQCEAVIVIGFRFADPYIRELFDFALRANLNLHVICSLTRSPDAESPLAAMMDGFPGRVLLLVDPEGNAIPFGHVGFEEMLEQTLTNVRQHRSPTTVTTSSEPHS